MDSLKSRIDIVDIMGRFMYLEKRGSKYWACCPFHHEKTPSFVINHAEQYYHCFGCGKSGNVISFLMEHENMLYADAIEWLAERAGMQMPDDESEEVKKQRQKNENALALLKFCARFYFNNLRKEDGLPALEYLHNRQISEKTIREFGIGYSTDYTSLIEALKKEGYSEESMLYAGVATKTEEGRLIDFETKRVIIPIINAKGQVIAFGGRILDNNYHNKYKNTSATALFDKKRNLFGLNIIKKIQQKENLKSLILVEGYMDVISLHQSGIVNSIASMGTSLTSNQCKEIKRFTNLIYVCFDGDAAGQGATWRSLDMLNDVGLEVRVMSLPDGMDPDDAVRKLGKEGFTELINEALPLTEFKIKTLAKKFDLGTTDGKSKFAKSTLDVFASLEPIERDAYIKMVSELSGLSEESIKNSVNDFKPEAKPIKRQNIEESEPDNEYTITADLRAKTLASGYLLSAFLNKATFVSLKDFTEEFFAYKPHREVYLYILRCAIKRQEIKIGDLFDVVGKAQDEVDNLLSYYQKIPLDKRESYYKECLRLLNKAKLDKERDGLIDAIKNMPDGSEKELLKEELRKLILNSIKH